MERMATRGLGSQKIAEALGVPSSTTLRREGDIASHNIWRPCGASVRKSLQASGIERSRRSVQDYVSAEHWPAKQVASEYTCAVCCKRRLF